MEKKNALKELIQEKKGHNIFHQNVRGLLLNLTSVQELISSNQNIDILTLSGTHISSGENNEFFQLSGYNFEQRHQEMVQEEGLEFTLKKSIDYIRTIDLEIVIEIVVNKSHNFLVATHYQLPKSSKYFSNNNNELLENQLSLYTHESKEIIILGNLNTNYLSSKDNKK